MKFTKKPAQILKSRIKGAISIEMSFILGFFALFLVLAFDAGQALILKTKLDRLSYSLASVVREREALYKNEFDKKDVSDLLKLARLLARDSIKNDLGLVVERASFSGVSLSSRGNIQVVNYSAGSLKCSEEKKIEDFKDASFFTTNGNYIPLYRVTLCAKPTQLFKSVFGLFSPVSSSLVYGR